MATGAFGGAPYGATERVRGVPNRASVLHANCATGTLGGAPYGATKRVRGVPKQRHAESRGKEGEEGGGEQREE